MFADLVVLNKTDLASDAEVDALEDRLRTMNAGARIVRDAQIATEEIADALRWRTAARSR